MKVELFYFDGCPNWLVADERLTSALSTADRADIKVEKHRVETIDEANRVGFIGSPTVRVDGVDPFATGMEQVGLSCRMYETPDGLDGSPTLEQFVEVLS